MRKISYDDFEPDFDYEPARETAKDYICGVNGMTAAESEEYLDNWDE